MTKLQQEIVKVARREIGVEEIDGTNCGPRVNQFKAATNLTPTEPWPWCAAFVDWVVLRAMEAASVKETTTFKRPTTAGAWDLINWSKRQDDTTNTKLAPGSDIHAGDIVVFTFSHTGIAVGDVVDGMVPTVEGNTDAAASREGGGVFAKTRAVSKVKARIRFTV